MVAEVIVAAVGDAFQLVIAPREAVFDIRAGFGVVREFIGLLVINAEAVGGYALFFPPVNARLFPVFVPLFILAGFDEKFQFRLFKLSRS